jgi:hypothetical protein
VRVAVVLRDVGKAVLSKGARPERLGADSAASGHADWDSDIVEGIDARMAAVGVITGGELACCDAGGAKFVEGDWLNGWCWTGDSNGDPLGLSNPPRPKPV